MIHRSAQAIRTVSGTQALSFSEKIDRRAGSKSSRQDLPFLHLQSVQICHGWNLFMRGQ
jgi:hypothetical protein